MAIEMTANIYGKEREYELSFRHIKFGIVIKETASKQLDIYMILEFGE